MRARDRSGFALVELLVAMGLIGIVLTAIFGLVVGTMRFSSASQSTSDRLRELTNATGYVVDQIRGATSAVACGADCVEITVAQVDGIALAGGTQTVRLAIVPRTTVDPAWLEQANGGEYVLVERQGVESYLVLDLLSDASGIDVAGDAVTLAFQVQWDTRRGAASTPPEEPYVITVTPRNGA